MTIDELNRSYSVFCKSQSDCKHCKYEYAKPCQLAFGYDKALDKIVDKIESRNRYFEEYYPNDSVAIAEADVYLEIADKLRK